MPAGERNGRKAGQLARADNSTVLRVASADNHASPKVACDSYGGLRRAVHLVRRAPSMLICNMRTPAGLVNGARGTVVAVVLKNQTPDKDLDGAVSAASVKYVVVDMPKYCGPVFFPEHPKWVPIEPATMKHNRFKGWERRQLPLVLAWGITIHKSQGLTFEGPVLVDFAHQPTYQPVSSPGLAFVGMSRTTDWENQAFRNVPDYWEFRKMLQNPLFKWRTRLEECLDKLHDATA